MSPRNSPSTKNNRHDTINFLKSLSLYSRLDEFSQQPLLLWLFFPSILWTKNRVTNLNRSFILDEGYIYQTLQALKWPKLLPVFYDIDGLSSTKQSKSFQFFIWGCIQHMQDRSLLFWGEELVQCTSRFLSTCIRNDTGNNFFRCSRFSPTAGIT